MESSGSVTLARSHISCLRLVLMWLVKMPLLSPISHGPLALHCCWQHRFRVMLLQIVKLHATRQREPQGMMLVRIRTLLSVFLFHFLIQIGSMINLKTRVCWSKLSGLYLLFTQLDLALLPASSNLSSLRCRQKNPACDLRLWLVVLWSHQPTNILGCGWALSSWSWWWHTCSADKVPGPPGL